jgi:hypothetical protein
MSCRNMHLTPTSRRCDELVPIGLRQTVCAIRKAHPDRYAALLRAEGVAVEEDDVECPHNLDASWADCPLYNPR